MRLWKELDLSEVSWHSDFPGPEIPSGERYAQARRDYRVACHLAPSVRDGAFEIVRMEQEGAAADSAAERRSLGHSEDP